MDIPGDVSAAHAYVHVHMCVKKGRQLNAYVRACERACASVARAYVKAEALPCLLV